MTQKEKQPLTIEQYLNQYKIDLSIHKSGIYDDDTKLSEAAQAWASHRQAIIDVIEYRMRDIRKRILFTCTTYDLMPLRQSLKELVSVLVEFDRIKQENARRAKDRAKKTEEGAEIEPEPESANDVNSSIK